mgnify:CR=1 FL=1
MDKKEKITVSQNFTNKANEITTEKFEIKDWTFVFQKSGILPSGDLDQLVDKLKLQGIPDIVYGKNFARLINNKKNFVYEVTPQDSLSFVNFEKRNQKYKQDYDKSEDTEVINVLPEELKIKQAEHWKNKKVAEDADIRVLEKISDWTFSTPYKGTVREFTQKPKESLDDITVGVEQLKISDSKIYIEKTKEDIPLGNLTPQNPIKWYNEYVLFEDELGDCGLSQSTFRFRCMGDCFFGLLRYYLRIDDVIVRIYDTRIYHEYDKDYILREFSVRENTFDELKKKGFKFTSEFITDHRQSDIIYPQLDSRMVFKEKVFF